MKEHGQEVPCGGQSERKMIVQAVRRSTGRNRPDQTVRLSQRARREEKLRVGARRIGAQKRGYHKPAIHRK